MRIGPGLGVTNARLAPVAPSGLTTYEFYDPFTSSGALDGRTGWTWTATAPSDVKAQLVASGGVAKMSVNTNEYTHFVGHDTGNVAHYAEFDLDLSLNGAGSANRYYIIRGTDKDNHVYVSMPADNSQYTVQKRVSGSDTFLHASGSNFVVPAADAAVYRIEIAADGTITVFRNKERFGPVNTYAGLPSGTSCGIRGTFFALPTIAKDARIGPLNLTIAPARSFVARSGSSGSVGVSGTYLGTMSGLKYEARDFTTDATVQAQVTATSFVGAAGSYTATVSVPQGGPNRVYGSFSNDALTAYYSTKVMCGPAHVVWGQSEAGSYDTLLASNPYAGNRLVNTWNVTAGVWLHDHLNQTFYDRPTRSAYAAKVVSDGTGLPHGFFGTGVAARYLSSLIPGDVENLWNTSLVTPLATAGLTTFESALLEQGVAEAWNGTAGAANITSWPTDFGTFKTSIRSLSGNSALPVLVARVQQRSAAFGSDETARNAGYNTIIDTIDGLHNPAGGVYVSHSYLGISKIGGGDEHADEAGGIELARRHGLSLSRWVFGSIAYDGRGPLVTGATRSGAVVTLAISLNGATSVTGTNPTGYIVGTTAASLVDSASSPLAISSVVVTGNQIVITLSANPGAPVWVASHRGYVRSDSSLVVGNYAGGTTIPVYPTGPIQTN